MESQEQKPEHDFDIVVNAEAATVPAAEVTFEQVVEIAFPGGLSNPDNIFKVDYEDAASKPRSGSLAKGGHVEVKKHGTEFSVIRSVRS